MKFYNALVLCAALCVACVLVSAPQWWVTRSVINSNEADDYAVANLGQLKYVASKAAAELEAKFEAGEEAHFTRLIALWDSPPAAGVIRDDYAALTQGQLKAVAALFYDHLASRGYYGPPLKPYARYPWTIAVSDDDDYAVVNLGQLKYVFGFESTNYVPAGFSVDSDADGLPDWWEIEQGLDKDDPSDAATLVGGETNLQRYNQYVSLQADPTSEAPAGVLVYTP